MRLTVILVEGDEKWGLPRKIVDKLESREAKKALARYKINSLKSSFLQCSLNLEISYAVRVTLLHNSQYILSISLLVSFLT